MPKPVYIICSRSGAEDKHSQSVSFFQVIEKIRLITGAAPTNIPPIVEMRIAAAWMRDPEDKGREFEFETRILLPPDETIFAVGSGKFVFSEELHRSGAMIVGFVPVQGAGVMKIQNRIRLVGTEAWLTQEYPIIVERDEAIGSSAALDASVAHSN